MHIKKVICLTVAAAALTSCGGPLGGKDLGVVGTYRTYMTEHIEDGSIHCTATAKVDETLGLSGVDIEMDIDLAFHFGGQMEFKDVVVSYTATANGDWGMSGDTLRIAPDSTSISTAYAGSSAQSSVEEAMVRQLRKNVISGMQPKIYERYSKRSQLFATLVSQCSHGLIGKMPDSSVVILRKTN